MMNIHPSAVIEDSTLFNLPPDADILALVYIGGEVKIGRHVVIMHQCHITEGTIIEDDVFIGPGTVLTNTRHIVWGREGMIWKREPPIIRHGARIGANTTILAGVEIGEEVEIGAGSVVTKSIEAFMRAWGNPARLKGSVRGDEMYEQSENRY